MKRKNVMRVLSLFMLCVIITVTVSGGSVIYSRRNNRIIDTEDYKSKVLFEGVGVLESESKEDMVRKINEAGKDGRTTIYIEVESDFVGLDRPSCEASKEEIDALLKKQRRLLKEYHTKNNQRIAQELKLDNMDVTYSCGAYAPFICAEFEGDINESDLDKVYEVAKHRRVNKVYVRGWEKEEKQSEIKDTLKTIEADIVINNDKNAGKGVVVGVLEVNGVANINNSVLKDADLIVQDQKFKVEYVSDHANMMSIIVHSVAPGATILSSQIFDGFYDEIEWMLDNGANIINMSFQRGSESDMGEYTEWCAYCDYITRNAWVTFVGSAGNSGDGHTYITPPNGYNTVTVGAAIANCSGVCTFSSYQEKFNIDKPNIVAVGIDYKIPSYNGSSQGTSQAAALTSGAIAVLMQKNAYLKWNPQSVLSILMASAKRIDRYAVSFGFNEKAGTGALNLTNALASAGNTVRFARSSDSVGSFVSSRTVYLGKGQTIRVAFASLINSQGYVTTGLVTDYDLYLFDSDGTQVARCAGSHNCEFIEYSATKSGCYTVKIKQYSAKKTRYEDYCSYTYFIQ